MTVVRVTGRINCVMCEFAHSSGDIWAIEAPESYSDGSYICEIWAYDDAGNIGYRTAILWMYDGKCVKIEWLDNPYKIVYLNGGYSINVVDTEFTLRLVESGIATKYIDSGYICHYMRCSEA